MAQAGALWFETRGVAALLTMRVQDLILRSGRLAASRRMKPPNHQASNILAALLHLGPELGVDGAGKGQRPLVHIGHAELDCPRFGAEQFFAAMIATSLRSL